MNHSGASGPSKLAATSNSSTRRVNHTQGSPPATTRGYLGQPADTTGLAYLDNRYYDPTLGTFTSVDPLVATTGTPSLYANANPTTLTDPTGLHPCEATASPGWCGPFGAEIGPKSAEDTVAELVAAVQDSRVSSGQVQQFNVVCQMAVSLCHVGSSAGFRPDVWNRLSDDERAAAQANFAVAQLMFLFLRATGELVLDSTGGWSYRSGDVVPELAIDGDRSRVLVVLRHNGSPSFSFGVSTGFCAVFCLELGTSGAGLYARTGVGVAFDAPGVTWSSENPECGTDLTTVYGSIGVGVVQASAGWESGATAGSWEGFVQPPTVGGSAPRLTKVGPASFGTGVIHWWAIC